MQKRLLLIVAGSGCMLLSMAEVLFSLTNSNFMTHSLPTISLGLFALALLLSKGLWSFAGIGLTGWIIGDFLWFHSANQITQNPALYDLGYICLPLGVFASLYIWSKRKFPNISLGIALDGLIVGTTLGSLITILFFYKLNQDSQVVYDGITFALSYPVLDVVLLLFIILMLSRNGWQNEWSLFFAGAGLVCFTITDFSFAVNSLQNNGESLQTWNSMDMGRLLGGMLLAIAAHNPSENEPQTTTSSTKIVLPVICAIVSVGILMAERFFSIPFSSWVFAAISLGLVIARLINAYFERDKASKEKERQSSLSKNLLADMSHEMRTPLTNIIGQLEEFLRDNSKNKDHNISYMPITSALRSAGRMENTISKLLLLARAKSNNLDTRQIVNLWKILEEAVDETEILALQHHLVLKKPDGQFDLEADEQALIRVFINILSNCFRHTPPETTVEISAWESIKDDVFYVEISDNGPGIPEHMKDNLWDRYVKGDHPDSSGIGLALVKAIIEAHGGNVCIKDTDQKGCTFLIALPCLQEEFKPNSPKNLHS